MSKLKIEYKKVEDLVPYENNPRKNEEAVKYVANSIKEFGFKNPIIIDKNNVIVAGHTRIEAAKELGIEEVPTVLADDLTEEQIKAFRIADNKTAEIATWDNSKLSLELEDIGFDMTDFGFGDFELSILQGDEIDINSDNNTDNEQDDTQLDERYSANIGTVIYEPKETNHEISDLYEMTDEYDEAIEKIENVELRQMLRIRKDWFCNFKFDKIADYYAYQATPEEQRIFERLGLVLLDKNQMIENGFSKIVDKL